jgi:hypothetical protein
MAPRPIDVEIRSRGVDGVRRDLKLISEEGGNVGEKFSRSGRSIAGAFLEVARSGQLGGDKLKEVVKEGGEMATMFGSAGPIIGGVVLLGVAFYEAFSKGAEQIRDAQRALDDLNSAHLRLAADAQGNRLGAISEDVAARYRQAFAQIEKEAPGWGTKIGVALATSMGLGPDFFGGMSKLMLHEATANQLRTGAYGKGGELDLRSQAEVQRAGLANAGGFAAGTDPVKRFEAQLQVIELEREQAIQRGEMSAGAADARAAGKREALVRQGYDVEQRLGADVANTLAKIQQNVFDQRQTAEDIRYREETESVKRLTISEADRVAIIDQMRLKHNAITLEIQKQRHETEAMAHAQARQGSLNPVERIRGELEAIELKRKKSIEAGADEVDAARAAENEKRQLFLASVDAAVRSNESLGRIATRLALEPLINYLEGLAIKEGIEALKHAAVGDVAGVALHAGVAAAALAGAHQIAQIAGGGGGHGGGGSSGSGGGGGGGGGSDGSAFGGGQGRITVVVNGRYVLWDVNDPAQRAAFADFVRSLGSTGEVVFSDLG